MPQSAVHRLLRLCLALAIALPMAAAVTGAADAQERVERRSLLHFLFGADRGGAREAAPPRRQPAAQPRRTSRPKPNRSSRVGGARSSGGNRSTAAVAADTEVDKFGNARKVLVVGDFLAGGLAKGLEESFATSPGVVIVDRSNGSSGLVRDDYYNWPAELPGIIDKEKPDIVVVQIGSNDSQEMRLEGGREPVRSRDWIAKYGNRTDALISAVTDTGRPLVWVGVPSFNFTSLSADMVALNGIFKNRVERANGEFIDIWDGFVDEEGKFVFTGSDINGQQVRLRGSDGINMTKAGRRKMAFYAEKPIRRLLGSAADAGISATGLDEGSLPELNFPTSPLQASNPVRTLPVAMTDPELDGGSELMGGGSVAPVNLTPTPRDLLVDKGVAPEAPKGRIDDFSWPRPSAAN